jgi:ribonuclease BN (tRNA processing enzyme)
MANHERALGPLLEVIHDKNNIQTNGGLVESLESFDLREKFVDIFRIYLFGNYKASSLAKEYLDYTEFDISPRIIRKAEKHWCHYKNNIKQDEAFEIKKRETDSIFKDLHALFDENDRP